MGIEKLLALGSEKEYSSSTLAREYDSFRKILEINPETPEGIKAYRELIGGNHPEAEIARETLEIKEEIQTQLSKYATKFYKKIYGEMDSEKRKELSIITGMTEIKPEKAKDEEYKLIETRRKELREIEKDEDKYFDKFLKGYKFEAVRKWAKSRKDKLLQIRRGRLQRDIYNSVEKSGAGDYVASAYKGLDGAVEEQMKKLEKLQEKKEKIERELGRAMNAEESAKFLKEQDVEKIQNRLAQYSSLQKKLFESIEDAVEEIKRKEAEKKKKEEEEKKKKK